MNSVSQIILPDCGRLTFDPDGSESALGFFVALPIPMPKTVKAWTGTDGKPVAMWCDDMRIRPVDFATVWTGIEQYNADLLKRGAYAPEPPTLPPEDNEGEDDDA